MSSRRGVPQHKRQRRERFDPSQAEDILANALTLCGGQLATFLRQHHYVPGRRFAADFAWPAERLILEIQGGVWKQVSGHSGGQGIMADIERLNRATLAGWRLLRIVPEDCKDEVIGETLDLIERALKA